MATTTAILVPSGGHHYQVVNTPTGLSTIHSWSILRTRQRAIAMQKQSINKVTSEGITVLLALLLDTFN